MEVLRESFINDGGRGMAHKLTSEIKELLNSIEHNAVNAVLAREREEYHSYVKAVEDSKEAVIDLFQKLDREYQEKIERIRISQMEQILNLQKQLNENQQTQTKAEKLNERLKTIKDYVRFLTFHGELGPAGQEYYWWLIEQVQSLSGSVEIIERKRQELVKQLAIANERIERYEKALREIANEQEVGEGDFNAADVANNLIATAKEALSLSK